MLCDSNPSETISGGSAPIDSRVCDTSSQIEARETIPELISQRAKIDPNARAIIDGDEVITYGELEERSNRLAGFLVSCGAARNAVIAICVERSINFCVGALGIWKAGASYLPLDTSYPPERIAWILEDAQPSVLLARQDLARQLAAGKYEIIDLDRDWERIARQTSEPGAWLRHAEDLAYVIYTSGSTGKPKGVEVTHRNLSNLVGWHQSAFGVTPSDRASQLASLGFDGAVWEIWPYLAAGAELHLANSAVRTDPEALRSWIVRAAITLAFVPTPLAERLIRLTWPRETALRFLLTGADTLRSYPPADLPFTLVNNYGPTECTVVATSGSVPAGQKEDAPPTIGRPIANVHVYLLDEQFRQVAAGTPGEICIGGAGVARGYRNAPQLTAERFVPDPFDVHGRLYKSGDLGCYLPNGEIAFRGRIDEQIKIRGYRVEPGEIIARLNTHPMVAASTVIAREDKPAEKRLVAYVVPTEAANPTDSALREFVSSELPDYMVPSAFVKLGSLPMNANGKVDRASLPAPNEKNVLRDDAYVAPRNPVERRLAEMLGELLGLERVSVQDNFFMLGGHSLLGTQLIARTRAAFGVDLTLRTLFKSPTVAALAKNVEQLVYARLASMGEEEAARLLKATAAATTQ